MATGQKNTLSGLYDAMFKAYGPQHWWPGETPFEVIVGAILTQNTAWRNVERAIENLINADVLNAASLRDMSNDELAELIRPAGYFNIKARRLKSFIQWLWDRFDGDLDRMFAMPMDSLREELLSVNGVGRETADSILLYAGNLPTFVVDAYTARIMCRHGLIDEEADYEEIKELFESSLPDDVELFNEYHALLVQVGKNHCKPRPKCEGCPLEPFAHDIESND